MPGPPARHAAHAVACGDGVSHAVTVFVDCVCYLWAKRLCSGPMRTALLLLLALAASGPVQHRVGRRRVEVGGRQGRHALLRSARAGCDQDRSARGQRCRSSLRGRRCRAQPSPTAARQSPDDYRTFADRAAAERSVDHQYRWPGQRRDPHRAGGAAAHRLSLYLDGKLVTGFARNATSYALTDGAARHAQRECRRHGCSPATRFRSRHRSSSPCGRNRSRSRRSVLR